ncbi:MAG: NTP transferase domain-containing protein [Elainellaceae cyanobacterium]
MSDERSPGFRSTLILAGGRSSRMGQDKSLIEIDGTPMLRRVYDVAAACTRDVWVVTPWAERYRAILPSDCCWIHEIAPPEAARFDTAHSGDILTNALSLGAEEHITDPSGLPALETSVSTENSSLMQGPLVGFAQGLEFLVSQGYAADWVLLLACDLPRLRAEVLKDWMAELDTIDADTMAAMPHHSNGWEALCGFYRSACLPNLKSFIDSGGRSFQRWLRSQPVHLLDVPDTTMMINCNTPEDLENV